MVKSIMRDLGLSERLSADSGPELFAIVSTSMSLRNYARPVAFAPGERILAELMSTRLQNINEFFEFSRGQLTALAILALASLVSGGYLVVRAYTTPARETAPLPVFFGDSDSRLVGYFVVDPNTSPADSLELLPGIGKVLADRIVKYRQSNRFKEEVDITEVKGIGPKLFVRLRPYLRITRE